MKPPKPSKKEVTKYLKRWDKLDRSVALESSLKKLFTKTYPKNTNLNNVLIKVSALNDFYYTNIYSTYDVAKHIIELNIDKELKENDVEIVNKIANVNIKGKIHHFYSFSTKYCSHHKPKAYPIFDTFVEQTIKYFKREYKFAKFTNKDLKDYKKYKNIISEFREYFNLTNFNFKEIDKYLWLTGKKYFPKKY
jgi:hypothetical protein